MVGDFCAEPRLATPCTTAGVALADLPAIVVVIVSHNHDGHLDTNRVLALDQHAQSATLFIAGELITTQVCHFSSFRLAKVIARQRR